MTEPHETVLGEALRRIWQPYVEHVEREMTRAGWLRASPSIGSRIPPRGSVLRADLELRVAVRRCIRVTKGAIRAFWEAAG